MTISEEHNGSSSTMANWRYLQLCTMILLVISPGISPQVPSGKITGHCSVKCQPVEERHWSRMFIECFSESLKAMTRPGLKVEANFFPSNCGTGYVPCLTACVPNKVSSAVTHVVYSPWPPDTGMYVFSHAKSENLGSFSKNVKITHYR